MLIEEFIEKINELSPWLLTDDIYKIIPSNILLELFTTCDNSRDVKISSSNEFRNIFERGHIYKIGDDFILIYSKEGNIFSNINGSKLCSTERREVLTYIRSNPKRIISVNTLRDQFDLSIIIDHVRK